MKQIETKFFGVQEVDETQFITFGRGLPGFENTRQYILSKYNETSNFYVMQSVERGDLAFIMVEFREVVPEFDIELNEEIVSELKLTEPDSAIILVVVTISGELARATVNLAAPVVINVKELIGKQIILNHPGFSIKQPLFGLPKQPATPAAKP